ncbi:MAG: O-antigen ligase family protein [Flavobacteriales bacterium]|nr:O-antigen ligase family protein [Flavobacteriales bacterium]
MNSGISKRAYATPFLKFWDDLIGFCQFFGLAMLMVSLPFSNFFMSVFSFWLVGAWMLDVATNIRLGRGESVKQSAKKFLQNEAAIIFTGLYLFLLIGLFWTDDFTYAWKDLLVKLPLLFMPFLVLSLRPIAENKFRLLLAIFIAALSVAAIICLINYAGWPANTHGDVREISIFISHIRFSLLLALGICIVLIVFTKEKKWRFVSILIALFFLYFLWVIESITGFSVLCAVAAWFLFSKIFSSRLMMMRFVASALLIGGSVSLLLYLKNCYHNYFTAEIIDWNQLEEWTPRGEQYEHRPENHQLENGHYIFTYIAWGEVFSGWRQRSALHPDSADALGHPVKGTLIRYLTSKGLRKDLDGIALLTDDDVRSIERGTTSARQHEKSGIRSRIDKILFEYDVYRNGGNPSGHSVLQRIEFWRVAWAIITENFWAGTGTGDIRSAYQAQYEKMNSRLDAEHRLRAHNQYLTFWATLGIFGLLWFVWVIVHPVVFAKRWRDPLFMSFIIIAALSCLAEDTLETQAGVTFFAFMFSLLIARPLPQA